MRHLLLLIARLGPSLSQPRICSPHALRYAFLNASFQTGLRSVLDAAILREGEAEAAGHAS